jgi:hypothetical protein
MSSGPETVLGLIDALEDLDDVQNVYSNVDIPDEVLALSPRRSAEQTSPPLVMRVHAGRWKPCMFIHTMSVQAHQPGGKAHGDHSRHRSRARRKPASALSAR